MTPRAKARLLISAPLGQAMQRRRQALGLSRQDVARRAWNYRGHIAAYETGRSCPDLPTVFELAQALECTAADLLRDADEIRRGCAA